MIHLRTLNLEKIDEISHYSLIRSLSEDKLVCEYIAHDFGSFLEKQKSETDDKIETLKSYVIVKDNRYIGIVGSLKFSNAGILEVWYAIKKNLRGHGYGEKILAEITPYLIEHVDSLEDIELKIDKNNKASQKVALRNGYVKVAGDEVNGQDIYRYFGDFSKEDSVKKGR